MSVATVDVSSREAVLALVRKATGIGEVVEGSRPLFGETDWSMQLILFTYCGGLPGR